MAISQNFPSTRPSLNLNFARSRKLDSRVTFTRGSTGTYVDDAGLIRNAGINEARFDYDPISGESLGLLVEESRTNLVLQSTSPDNLVSPWSKGPNTTRIGTTTSPDGTDNAINYSGDGSGGNEFIVQTVSLSSNTTYTASLWAKLISGASPTGGAIISAEYNNGTSNVRATVTYSGNLTTSWKRFSVTFTNVNSGSYSFFINADQNTTAQIAIWGAQLEAGSFATSFISTSGSTVTRSADSASITGTNFSDWYNAPEGTIFAAARINALGGGTYPGITYVDDGTANNCIGFYINDAGNDVIGAEAYVSGVSQYGINSPSAIIPNQLTKVISAYKVNDFAAAYSMGGSVGTDNSGSIPTVNRLIIGDLRGNNAKLNGHIAQLFYYPVRLTNTQLQTLTK